MLQTPSDLAFSSILISLPVAHSRILTREAWTLQAEGQVDGRDDVGAVLVLEFKYLLIRQKSPFVVAVCYVLASFFHGIAVLVYVALCLGCDEIILSRAEIGRFVRAVAVSI